MRPVQKDITETEQLPTGLEGMTLSDTSKAPQHVKKGKREYVEVEERTVLCDVFGGYSDGSGNASYDQTLMRDIAAYYKEGHLLHATAATHRGVPLPIGKDSESAKPSEYDMLRLERRKNTLAAQEKEKEAEEEQRRQEREADSATAHATALEPEPEVAGGKQLKKRASAGRRRAATEITSEDAPFVNTDGRGTLKKMRLMVKFTDGCGVQYVQRQAALGTASFYGDTEVSE